jgi:hypothetical protein
MKDTRNEKEYLLNVREGKNSFRNTSVCVPLIRTYLLIVSRAEDYLVA